MKRGDDLLPLKRVLELIEVSRATLWRVSRSGIEGFPKATRRGGRVYWREDEIDAIKRGVDAFEGRTAFDRKKRTERRRAETRHETLTALKKEGRSGKRPRSAAKKLTQGDLFGA